MSVASKSVGGEGGLNQRGINDSDTTSGNTRESIATENYLRVQVLGGCLLLAALYSMAPVV